MHASTWSSFWFKYPQKAPSVRIPTIPANIVSGREIISPWSPACFAWFRGCTWLATCYFMVFADNIRSKNRKSDFWYSIFLVKGWRHLFAHIYFSTASRWATLTSCVFHALLSQPCLDNYSHLLLWYLHWELAPSLEWWCLFVYFPKSQIKVIILIPFRSFYMPAILFLGIWFAANVLWYQILWVKNTASDRHCLLGTHRRICLWIDRRNMFQTHYTIRLTDHPSGIILVFHLGCLSCFYGHGVGQSFQRFHLNRMIIPQAHYDELIEFLHAKGRANDWPQASFQISGNWYRKPLHTFILAGNDDFTPERKVKAAKSRHLHQ